MGDDQRRRTLTAAALLGFALLAPADGEAQRVQADSIIANGNGTLTVWVGGMPFVAFDPPGLRQLKNQEDSLRVLRVIRAELDSITRIREREIAEMDRLITSGNYLMAQQRQVIDTRDRLIRELRADTGRRFGVRLGGGFSEHDGVAGITALTWDRWGMWALRGTRRGFMLGGTIRLARF